MIYKKHKGSQGFTLVELIVVVTILAILSTIGFVSYSSYLTGVRDTNRLAQLVSISDGLELYRTKNDLPLPDDNVEVKSGTTNVIAYQGYAGSNTLETIDFTKGGKDPKDDSYFTYYLTQDRNKFQLMGFLEEDVNTTSGILLHTYAVDYSNRIPAVYGKKLGILTDEDNTPIQEISTIINNGELDISTTDDSYIAYMSDFDSISGTGSTLVIIEQIHDLGRGLAKSCASILRADKNSKDGFYKINPTGTKTIDVYCDMTVAGGGWTLAVATYYAGSNNSVGHLVGANAYGVVSDATTGVTGSPGGRYKLADTDIKAIQDLSTKTDSADYLFNQIGYNNYYSGGNNEYVTFENYTAEWDYGATMPNSSTSYKVTSYRRSDGAIALQGFAPANSLCGGGEFGINCTLTSVFGNGGGGNCDIDLRTLPASSPTWAGQMNIFMENTNADNYLAVCNGYQHTSSNRYKARYFIRERN